MKDVFITIKDFSFTVKKSISTITLFVKDNLIKYNNLLKKIEGKYFMDILEHADPLSRSQFLLGFSMTFRRMLTPLNDI